MKKKQRKPKGSSWDNNPYKKWLIRRKAERLCKLPAKWITALQGAKQL